MTQLFKLKPVRNFHSINLKVCATCKYLASLDGPYWKCKRPNRLKGKKQPFWPDYDIHKSYSHTCDRWTKKELNQ